jgi:hypothetical protein
MPDERQTFQYHTSERRRREREDIDQMKREVLNKSLVQTRLTFFLRQQNHRGIRFQTVEVQKFSILVVKNEHNPREWNGPPKFFDSYYAKVSRAQRAQ